ncbi:predicted protein [Sclerotinia sclerotiorum 1980 UF-70]|uniref:Uncharacterized protein n=1 Tax=Sclerotinia sclerotiorum (strain ATCC 18683 / 1980 / Ss-1) TaxID=665079 RepID=A7ENL4_SCLS1|nr:predicted protein [Sclerotinia sclerotiorum 1980 UF-70]EDO04430.1 predicted protein [Sclerotinia sclerotiorum 1980 UF-70]
MPFLRFVYFDFKHEGIFIDPPVSGSVRVGKKHVTTYNKGIYILPILPVSLPVHTKDKYQIYTVLEAWA